MSDPFYRSREWKALRLAALTRDLFRCVVPRCRNQAVRVDHIVPRKDGGADTLDNLRSLCAMHDNQSHREKGRRTGGPREARFNGCDAAGNPVDPSHWWNAPPKISQS